MATTLRTITGIAVDQWSMLSEPVPAMALIRRYAEGEVTEAPAEAVTAIRAIAAMEAAGAITTEKALEAIRAIGNGVAIAQAQAQAQADAEDRS